MVLVGLVKFAPVLLGMRSVWFIDNIAALISLVRGRSISDDPDSMSLINHCAPFALRTWVHFRWVKSASNWSDDTSRTGLGDPWHRAHCFAASQCNAMPRILRLPFRPAIRFFEFLQPSVQGHQSPFSSLLSKGGQSPSEPPRFDRTVAHTVQ